MRFYNYYYMIGKQGLKSQIQFQFLKYNLMQLEQEIQDESQDELEQNNYNSAFSQVDALQNIQFFQNSQNLSDESVNSIQQRLVFEHMSCLKESISKINTKIFRITPPSQSLEILNYNDDLTYKSLQQYLIGQQSLIDSSHIPFFMQYLQKNSNLKKIVYWIYDHAQPKIGDELILIILKIILAYIPIRLQLETCQQISLMSRCSFNLFNIYCDPKLKILVPNYSIIPQEMAFDIYETLSCFYVDFLETILLVLEQYFSNPQYSRLNLIQNKQEQKQIINKGQNGKHKPISKKKKII